MRPIEYSLNRGSLASAGRDIRLSRVAALVLLATLIAGGVFAQSYPLYTPVHIGTDAAIQDEFGNLLKGSAATSPSKRDLVQVLWASNSVINPPAYDGTPDPNNPPVEGGTTGIGDLVSPTFITPARFCVSLANPRPPQNSRIFVRVFNAPTTAAASFYTDSQLMQVHDNDLLMADFGSTTNPIDPRDFDGDGLNNSWEKSMFSDPNKWDTDGDGVNDAEEFLARTDLLDPDSAFVTVWLETDAANDAILTWDSVAGMTYQVQHTGFTDASLSYSNVSATIVADGPQTQTTVTNGMADSFGKYRVRLLPDREL